MMKVSVITATYNSAATVADTLRSVRDQSYPLVEHLIIDGGSKDNTMEIVAGFPHIKQICSEKDRGIYDAMNKGVKRATGDIVGILNSDDFYASENVLREVVDTFEQSGCDAVYGDLQYVDKDDVSKVVRYWRSGPYQQGAFKWGWMPPHPSFFVRHTLYDRCGLFNLDMKTAADYELMLRMIHKEGASLQYLPNVLVKMRTGGASNSSLASRLKANADDRKAWDVNGLTPYWFTMYLKPIRKITQFIFK
ncbi:MAG: glycosyltransferase family 2 protein [Sphingobacteriales bacterium]|jgi:glycosyltransferase involved in cell wall biosynthesis